jgi:hypothetical protein
MQTSEIIACYQTCIHTIEEHMDRAAKERQWVGEWQEKLKYRETQILTTEPPEGTNAEERAANPSPAHHH